MSLANIRTFLLTAGVVVSAVNYTQCGSMDNVNIDVTTPCKNVADAIDRLYESLSNEIPMEARCKRYAVFLSMAESAPTNELALLQLSSMEDDMLNKLYQEMSPVDRAFLYTNAIDIYRKTLLKPAFIDLIECLKEADLLDTYLNDPESVIMVDLYRRALGPPISAIDLDSVDLGAFSPAFRTTLEKLFEKHSENLVQVPDRSASQINLFNQLSPSYSSQSKLAELFIKRTEERLRKKENKRERNRRYRERHLERIRERDRLRNKKKERVNEKPSPNETMPTQRPEESSDRQSSRIERSRRLNRERQRRYRERNLQLVRARERERERRKRRAQQLERRYLQSGAISEQQQGQEGSAKESLLPPDQSQSIQRPTVLGSSLAGQLAVDRLELLLPEQVRKRQRRPGELTGSEERRRHLIEEGRERRRRLRRKRYKRYRDRNPTQSRDQKRRWRQRQIQRDNPQGDLSGSTGSASRSQPGLEN